MKGGAYLLLFLLGVMLCGVCGAQTVEQEFVYQPSFDFFTTTDKNGIWTTLTVILWLAVLLPFSFRKVGYLPTLPLRAVLSGYIATPLIFMMVWCEVEEILGDFTWVLLLSQPLIVFSALMTTPCSKVVCAMPTAILAALYFTLPVILPAIFFLGGCPMS